MAKRRRTAEKVEDEEVEQRPRPRRKRRFMVRLAFVGLMLAIVVGLAPLLIANSPFRDMLLNWQMPVGGWRIACGKAGISWIGSQSLAGVAIVDPAGNPLVTVESLAIERSLLGMIVQPNNLGTIRIVKPVACVATRAGGSNIEDFLAAIEKQQADLSEPATSKPKTAKLVDIEIVEGTLRGLDTVSGDQWRVEQINLTSSRDANSNRTVDGHAVVVGKQADPTGRVKFRIVPIENGQQQLDVLAENLLLEPLAPWIARFVGNCQIAGLTGLDAHITWSHAADGGLTLNTWGRTETNNLSLATETLKGDELRCDKLVIPWKVSAANGMLSAEELKLDCEWAELAVRGSVAVADLQTASLANLPKRECDITGKVSLAKLAKMLPRALQIREGVRIDAGDVEVQAKSGEQNSKFRWSANVSLANLVGQDRGRSVEWKEPLEISANWIDSPDGPRLDRVTLAAPFASGDFTTTADRIDGEFQLDLAELTQELGQFVDLAGITARGTASGKLTLTASEGDAFATDADVRLSELAVTQADKPLWEEPQLSVKIQAVGSAVGLAPKSISTGSAQLRGARDALTMKLLSPVDLTGRGPWSVDIDGTGALDSWAGRLRPWSNGVPDEMSGEAAIQAKVTADGQNFQISDLAGSVNQLHIRRGKVAVDEPHVKFAGDCWWNSTAKKMGSRQLELVSSVIAFRSQDLRFELGSGQVPVMTGKLAFRADLERLAGAAGIVGGREAPWPRGSASAVMQFATNSEQVFADFTFDAEQLQLVKSAKGIPPVLVWSEPRLHSAGKAVYTIADQRATIENLQLDGQTLQVSGSAAWDKPLDNGPIAVNGNLKYDGATLNTLIAGYAGPTFNIEGDRIVRFEVRGQLPTEKSKMHWSRTLQTKVEAGWTKAAVFGLPISAGKLQGTLANGQLQTAPLDVTIGAGRLTTNPLAIFDPAPQKIVIPPGPLLTNVQISPAVSEQMLKYVAPILAGATRIDGQFSVDLNETIVPLADPKQLNTLGRLAVHQLTVLPGPMVADLANLIQQIKSLKDPQKLLSAAATPKQSKLLSMNDQQIDFKVIGGRVYHRSLQFIIDDVPISSQGSVGFDQTLALELVIPIQDRWIDGEDALRGLAGQSLLIPIKGTFQSPRIDQRAFTDITKQILQSTARDAIGGEINRQLEKLFQGK